MSEEDAARIDAMITKRLHAFHDALVERGQLPPHGKIAPPDAGGTEIDGSEIYANRCTEEHAA
jgi:hypothetical protein